MASQRQWLQQDAALVRYRDDETLLHCRLILLCLEESKCIVCTPDRDIETTVLEVGDTYSEIKRMIGGRLPSGVRDQDTYLPRHSDLGTIGPEEARSLVFRAERMQSGVVERRRVTGKVDEHGRVFRDGGTGGGVASVPVAALGPADLLWLVVFRTGSGDLGEEVTPPSGSRTLEVSGKRFHLFPCGDEVLLTQGYRPSEVEKAKDTIRLQKGSGGDKEERDLRILPILFDSSEERYRTVAEAVPEYEEVEFDDYPLQGPRTLYHDSRQLRRMGLDFLMHHEGWIKKSGVRISDRSVHEHGSICRALHYMMTYDQLNLPSLASAEALNRRRTLIEHAHQGRPDAPDYAAGEDMLGYRESGDGSIIDPALTQHAARKQAQRAEVLKQTRLAAEERKQLREKPPKGDGKGPKKEKAPENP